MIKFGYTILYTKDVERAVSFYEAAFGFQRKFVTPENDYGELNTGTTTLSFCSIELANSNLKSGFTASRRMDMPFGIEICLVMDEVEPVLAKAMANGAALAAVPVVKPWGQTVAYIRDLDGFLIELCTPMIG